MILANDAGHFKEELTPVKITAKRQEVVVNTDEHPRPKTTIQSLTKLAPVFKKDGIVTAGSASVREAIFFIKINIRYKNYLSYFRNEKFT